ncbi:Uma2 family endonuclease [Thermus islandicus]|uniref:Uma2 family endonuclease n=1 Tax=Thermus islandicus TaxID=540988 RepID=UPI001FDFA2B2|nr:Uma2 family endonuclease [Thermus islandicus]
MPLLDLLRPVSEEELRALSEKNPGWPFERLADGRRERADQRRRPWTALPLERGVGAGGGFWFKLPDGSVLAPDAVFKVRSRSQSLEGLRGKAAWYLKNGVPLWVLLDPHAHRLGVFRPGGIRGRNGGP